MSDNTTATNTNNQDEVANQDNTTTSDDKATNTNDNTGAGAEMSREDLEKALAKARKEAARYRTERNDLRGDAEKYREAKEAEKSELEKAQEANARLQRDYEAMQAQNKRLQVVSRFGITEDNIDLLGNDPEKFEANAERIAALQKAEARRPGPPSDYPREYLKPGSSEPENTPDYNYLAAWPVTGPFANN
ncbi:hypothetical protein [Corynebacterium tapiri]|uniref:Scaffolding protein n=1 Tax=Corynebacterium tapiri TaxID=1448266 RepID=A0A5C4U5N0_9CORY|nr:hypothetical protein [Corynebacterium tapiri]TNL98781.1 hypothetical protein FHE74_03950 [Corynebacterium tapiri]